MTKQILFSLLNCSWQWGLLGGLTWLITRRSYRSNSTVHLLWLLFLLSLPILFALNQFVPALSIGGTVPELTQAQPVHVSSLATQDMGLPEVSSIESATQSQSHLVTGSTSILNWATIDLHTLYLGNRHIYDVDPPDVWLVPNPSTPTQCSGG